MKRLYRTIITLAICAVFASCKTQQQAVSSPETPSFKPRNTEFQALKLHKSGSVWGDIEYHGNPWVTNLSRPIDITQGLRNRHITVWASHGRYYDIPKGIWKWQRPFLFGTTEDLFTQTIVVPYLIPMLEKAGANVFSPRERDWQKHEVIVDNDDRQGPSVYAETNGNNAWQDAATAGFANREGVYHDQENPFSQGTTRQARAVRDNPSTISYQPMIPQTGDYAVYVSYPTLPNSVDDARYTVYHQGQRTDFRVNQQMGGGTWVYLGTFRFGQGCNEQNRVVLTNISSHRGSVTADAVRFGGGMGNIERGGSTSGMMRSLEGARYYAQWAGAPYNVYSSKSGQDDYADDINARSFMSNWLAGGSCYVPSHEGKNVPIELSVAIHSDAGYAPNYTSVYGSLGICTTNFNEGKLDAGISREASRELMTLIQDGIHSDITRTYGEWVVRELRDANYSETRCPEVPSTIVETLSHQNFPDMVLAQDPNFRFLLARSIYKSILRFVAKGHGDNYTVAPLPPRNVSVEFTSYNSVTLSWEAEPDSLEKTAKPTSYIIYTAAGNGDFDNGHVVRGTSCNLQLEPDVVYSFKIAAVNKGGESFPSETVSALHHAGATRSILIVDGFHRLAAPAVMNTLTEQGFDYDEDPGVPYIKTAGMSGRQLDFDKKNIGIEGPGGLGYSGQEWQGMIIAGNGLDNIRTHAEAMMPLSRYNVASCSSKAVENGKVDVMKYHIIDLLLGLEKQDQGKLRQYKAFPVAMQSILRRYCQSGGALMVSGSYVASDMKTAADSLFLSDVLKIKPVAANRCATDSVIQGMGTTFPIYRQLNETHYAATSTDLIEAVAPAYCALTIGAQEPVCVAYAGADYHALTIGFPFECIKDEGKRRAVMTGIINFLIDH